MSTEYHSRLEKIRSKYPKAYEPWSQKDEITLLTRSKAGMSLKDLSRLLQRQPGAIQSRLRKLSFQEDPLDSSSNVTMQFQFEWEAVLHDKNTAYHFPKPVTKFMIKLYQQPAIYRWRIYDNNTAARDLFYIGTTKELCPDRLNGYLNPGKSRTNRRLNREFHQNLLQGYKIGLDILRINQLVIGDLDMSSHDLGAQHKRQFIEGLLIAYYSKAGFRLLN